MANWKIDNIVHGLQQARHDWRESQHRPKEFGGRELPSKEALKAIVDDLCGILFPMRLGPADLRQEGEDVYIAFTLDKVLSALYEQVRLTLAYEARYRISATIRDSNHQPDAAMIQQQASSMVQTFANALPDIRRLLDSDVQAAYEGDPAARSVDEVLLCYPGMLAITYHRLAHVLYQNNVPLLARMIAELAHSATGIDIHPGAQIGKSFFIDHGTGVVIGETCIIGARVRIYQAVTLGAKRFEVDDAGNLQKDYARHPVVEDDVVIYAGATILGRVTIGKGSVIGGNVWLTHDIPPHSQIMQSMPKPKISV
ncbi:serine O-acetyltransferase EpsC [Alkanindiges hydrocarboniclasticus]|uniref:serine O-acetyltransferase EpsC n=1 Tax=Alkanindiges hydrocarboniclasticus TaxID=1907941 RepID=UPI001D0D6BB3|nr:serine O-acetyltransferase EpsC [Alkanindiges hydrocarboniclasticus]